MIVAFLVAIAGWYRNPAAAVSLSCIGLVFNFASVGWHIVMVMPGSQILLNVGVFIASVVPAYFTGVGLRWVWDRHRGRSSLKTDEVTSQFTSRPTIASAEEENGVAATNSIPAESGATTKEDVSRTIRLESPNPGGEIAPQPAIVRSSARKNWARGLSRIGVIGSTIWIGVVLWVLYRWEIWEAEETIRCTASRTANPSLGNVFACYDTPSFDDAVYAYVFPFQSLVLKNIEVALLPAGFPVAAALLWAVQGFRRDA